MSEQPSAEAAVADHPPIRWAGGKEVFYVSGTHYRDDTLRIVTEPRDLRDHLTLMLPTLCITYADMTFANSVGGAQADYPDSAVYGPRYFDPTIVIEGEEEIEKFTWIRNARRVEIGKQETIVRWSCGRPLVIPRLRIQDKEKVKAIIRIPEMTISVSQPFEADIMQYTAGRSVGGIQIAKAHPKWHPDPTHQEYSLRVRVIDDDSQQPIPEARVSLFAWQPERKEFVLEPPSPWFTNQEGIVDVSGLTCSGKRMVTVEHASRPAESWRFLPLPEQKIRRTFALPGR